MDIAKIFKNFLNIEKPTNSVLVTKDKNGQWWFLGIYSNKFKDLDGEILSEESHKEYRQWLKDTGFKPVITAYHLPRAKSRTFWTSVFDLYENNAPVLQKIVDSFYKEMAFAKVERVIYANGFTFTLAKFLPGKEAIAEKLSKMKNLGMSHGFINKDSSANIFNKYRTFEMSVLRSVRAANPFTVSGAFNQKGNNMAGKDTQKSFSPEDRITLVELLGEEVIGKIESSTEKVAEVLTRHVDYKNSEEEKEAETEKTEETPETPDQEVKEEGLSLEVVAKATREAFVALEPVLKEMQEKIEALETKNADLESKLTANSNEVKQIKKTEDEKIAESWLPSLNWRGGYSASQAKDNVVANKEEKKNLTEDAPEGKQKVQDSVLNFALAPLFNGGLRG